jgi:protein-disulfide isomerase
LIKKYPKDVNMVFRQMPLPQLHPTAPLGAQAAVCVGQLGGADKFYNYLALAFAANEFTDANVTDMAVSLGINKSKFVSCLTSEATIAKVNAETQEGQGFGIS